MVLLMDKDIVLNKINTIERCIKRIKEEYCNDPENLKDYTKQDSIILNIQRACEASIDLAMHYVAEGRLGIPQSSRDVFDILANNNVIDDDLSVRLKAMVGFRNVAVHDYQNLNLAIVEKIIQIHLTDLKILSNKMLTLIL